MQVQALVHAGAGSSACRRKRKHVEPDGNILSRGEDASSPALVRPKRPGTSDYELLLISHLLSDLWASWHCEYSFIDSRHDGIDNFCTSVYHYAKNTGCSLAEHSGSCPFMPTSGSLITLIRRRHIGSTVMSSAIASFGWPLRRPIGIDRSLDVTNTTRKRWQEIWLRDVPP